jgi:hypothetical protein
VTALEERLRGELRAESEIITPESIAPLRLPGDTDHVPRRPRLGGARRWPEWAKPLAAAAAAVVVIAGTFAIAHALPGLGQQPWSPTPAYAGVPRYYAYTLPGDIFDYTSHGTEYSASVGGRYLRIRATGSGKLITVLAPPKPYNNFQMISADATGTVFVLGAMHDWQRYANTRPSVFARNQATPMRFLAVRITGGRARSFGLHLPVTVTPGQGPSMALSPDGARLALAYGGRGRPAVVDVITLPDGRVRRWTSPRVPWAPLLSGRGAWTADGRTLVLQEGYVPPVLSRSALSHYHPPADTPVRLIDTAAPGSSLAAGKLLVLHAPAGESAPQQVFITPDGTKLIAGTGEAQFRPRNGIERGALSVYSAWTGALLQRLAPWKWNENDRRPGHGGGPQEQLAWSNPSGSQLIVLHPVDDRNILGSLTGGTFRTAGAPLPRQPAGYQELQNALRTGTQLAW